MRNSTLAAAATAAGLAVGQSRGSRRRASWGSPKALAARKRPFSFVILEPVLGGRTIGIAPILTIRIGACAAIIGGDGTVQLSR
jgi:hypothetical protein